MCLEWELFFEEIEFHFKSSDLLIEFGIGHGAGWCRGRVSLLKETRKMRFGMLFPPRDLDGMDRELAGQFSLGLAFSQRRKGDPSLEFGTVLPPFGFGWVWHYYVRLTNLN